MALLSLLLLLLVVKEEEYILRILLHQSPYPLRQEEEEKRRIRFREHERWSWDPERIAATWPKWIRSAGLAEANGVTGETPKTV